MSMYPSLEDMKVDQMARAQHEISQQILNAPGRAAPGVPYPTDPQGGQAAVPYPLSPSQGSHHQYPSLGEYMGLEFTDEVLALNMPEYLPGAAPQPGQMQAYQQHGQVAQQSSLGFNQQLVAPVSSPAMNVIAHATPTNSVRQVVVCKGNDGKVGIRVKDISKGVFISLVQKDSPAALAGLRFGDQILEINSIVMAGCSMDKVHSVLKKSSPNGITLAVRDRPFERSITLHKDSSGGIGFQFKDGEVKAIVKDSSAARNGMLIEHQMLEVNGQNVVGLKDKEITAIVRDTGSIITVTVMPCFVFKHIVKNMATNLTKVMDHSLPLL